MGLTLYSHQLRFDLKTSSINVPSCSLSCSLKQAILHRYRQIQKCLKDKMSYLCCRHKIDTMDGRVNKTSNNVCVRQCLPCRSVRLQFQVTIGAYNTSTRWYNRLRRQYRATISGPQFQATSLYMHACSHNAVQSNWAVYTGTVKINDC